MRYTFTTAEEGAKFAPSVVVTSPVDLERYAVGDTNTLKAMVFDDDGLSTTVTEYFNSVAGVREREVFYYKDAADYANSALWTKSSATMETETVAGEGLVVTTKDEGDSTLSTTISDNRFKNSNTQVDVTLNFGNNTDRRKVAIGGVTVAEFRKNGTVVDSAGTEVGGGMKYSANTDYTFSLISDAATGMGVCLLNGHVVRELVEISASAEMKIEITQTLSKEGSAEFTIVDFAAYLIGAAVTDATITLNKEAGTIADGATYAGNASLTFTTAATSAEKLVVVNRGETGADFNVREISYTSLGDDGATVEFTPTIANASGAEKTVYAAIVVYKGNKIVNKTIESKSIPVGGGNVSVSAVVPEIAEDVTVQAFILDSLTSPKSIAEDVFEIK